ncbi:MAG: capsule biosynthesis GfcC family protein, partial [Shewanella sp.]
DTQLAITTSSQQSPALQMVYPSAVRLSQVVQDGLTQLPRYQRTNYHQTNSYQTNSAEAQPVYWLGAALLDMGNTAELEAKRQQVLTQLAQIGQQADDSRYIAKLAKLAQFIRHMPLGKRVMQPLDIDVIRVNESYNAMISGQYQLVLPPRPNTITVAGAVAQTGTLPWQSQASSQDYLQQASLLPNADNSYVWIIQPDGHGIKQPIAYWNQQAQDIAPGATLYVEFSSPFDDYSSLNDNIIELLKNRAL